MILLSYSNSSIKGTEILGSVLYLSLLGLAIFVCMQSGRKFMIFHFNSWLSFQRLCRLLQGYCNLASAWLTLAQVAHLLQGLWAQGPHNFFPTVIFDFAVKTINALCKEYIDSWRANFVDYAKNSVDCCEFDQIWRFFGGNFRIFAPGCQVVTLRPCRFDQHPWAWPKITKL